jgi:hypothetical protein
MPVIEDSGCHGGRESNEEKGQADVLLEEEREDTGGSCEEVLNGADRSSLQEIEGEEDGEDGVAVVDGVGIDSVDAEEGKRGGEEEVEFEAGVVDGEADVAVGFGEAADGFHLVDVGLEHDDGDGDGLAGGLDGADGGVAVDVADLHEDADAALDQLGVLHVHVDHEVVVDVAEPGHGAGGDHVEDHLLGGGGLHAGGAGDDLGADLGDDGGVGDLGERGVGLQVMAAVLAPRARAYSTAPTT